MKIVLRCLLPVLFLSLMFSCYAINFSTIKPEYRDGYTVEQIVEEFYDWEYVMQVGPYLIEGEQYTGNTFYEGDFEGSRNRYATGIFNEAGDLVYFSVYHPNEDEFYVLFAETEENEIET